MKVSVVMSVHNGACFLADSIESILKQTFRDFEFIIVDDGSTEDVCSIIEHYARDDERIRLIKQRSRGLTISLVEAINISRGDYIARQDADDISHSNRLEKQVNILEIDQAVGLVGTAYDLLSVGGVFLGRVSPLWEKGKLYLGNPFVHGSLMFRRSLYEKVGGYDVGFKYSQDYDLVVRICKVSEAHITREPLYGLRRSVKSVSDVHKKEQAYYAVLVRLKNGLKIPNCLEKLMERFRQRKERGWKHFLWRIICKIF